jgi:alkyl sulfatase BDS1-like metallo-beta-lactamase superfamily hydrolase
VKAIYQRYLGWFDGNPAHLWQLPPAQAATRYVDCLGGAEAIVAKAQEYVDDGDLRFAAELLNHAVFADERNRAARSLLADVYDTLGFGSENATWRNFYLQGAYELRHEVQPAALDSVGAADMVGALSVDQLFDSVAIRIDGPNAWDAQLAIDWVFTDLGHTYRTELRHGVLIQDVDPKHGTSDFTVTLTKPDLLRLLGGSGGLEGLSTEGDPTVVATLLSVLDPPTPGFAIVTP